MSKTKKPGPKKDVPVVENTFIILFDDKSEKRLTASEVNPFIRDEKRRYLVLNENRDVIFKKSCRS